MQMKKTAAIALAFAMVSSAGFAQNYPNRPITLLVPFAAGGATDTVARVTAQSMSKLLGQTIVIENATGAGGTIAATRASRAEPDGYTLMIHHIGISTAATLYRKLAYDTKTAFAPVGLVTNAPMTIIGRPDLPPNTLADLVTYIKANGDKMSFGNAGLGAASHLCGMLFMTAVGKEILTVPYKGNAPIMNDLIGKQIDLSCDQTTNTTAPIASKQVKAYAITTKSRLASMPDLPSADEAGLKGFELGAWHGIYAPKGTPDDIIQKLAKTLAGSVARPGSGEAVQRHQHRTCAAERSDARGPEGKTDQRGRSLGADHQGGRSVRGLRPLSARRRTAASRCRWQFAPRSLAAIARARRDSPP